MKLGNVLYSCGCVAWAHTMAARGMVHTKVMSDTSFRFKRGNTGVRTCARSCVMPANVENNFGHASRNAKFLLHHRKTTPLPPPPLPTAVFVYV